MAAKTTNYTPKVIFCEFAELPNAGTNAGNIAVITDRSNVTFISDGILWNAFAAKLNAGKTALVNEATGADVSLGGGSSISKNLEPKAYVTSRVSNFDFGVVAGSGTSGNPNVAFGGYKRSKVIIRNPVGNAGDLSVIYQPIINNISGNNSPAPVATLTPGNELVDYNSCGQWRVRSTLATAPVGLIVNVEIEEFI